MLNAFIPTDAVRHRRGGGAGADLRGAASHSRRLADLDNPHYTWSIGLCIKDSKNTCMNLNHPEKWKTTRMPQDLKNCSVCVELQLFIDALLGGNIFFHYDLYYAWRTAVLRI